MLGSGERESFRPQEFGAYYRRVRARLERFVAEPPPTEPWPSDHCGDLRLQAASATRTGTRSTTSAASPGSAARRSRSCSPPGSRRSPTLGRARGRAAAAGIAPRLCAKIREQAELQLWRARARRRPLRAARAAARRRLRAPARARRRRSLLRLRGQPVLGHGRRPRVPLGDPRRRPPLHAAPRARPRRASGARSSSSSTSSTRACASTPTCTSTTTPRTRSPRSSG